MAVAFGSAGTYLTYTSRTNSTLVAPASIANGDLLLAYLMVGGASNPATPTPPAGWNTLTGSPISANAGGFFVKYNIFYKIAASEAGNYTFTHATASSCGLVVRYTGVDNTTPFSPTPTTNSATGSSVASATGFTTTAADTFIIFTESDWADNTNDTVVPTGTTPTFTERLDTVLLYIADGTLATPGATGNKTHTTNTTGGGGWTAYLIGLNPAAGGGAGTTLSANPGSYTLTGTSVGLAGKAIAGGGSYTLTGTAAALAVKTVAGAGSYALTGSNAALTASSAITHGSQLTLAMVGPWALQGVAKGSETLTVLTTTQLAERLSTFPTDGRPSWISGSNYVYNNNPTNHGGVVPAGGMVIDGYTVPAGTWVAQFYDCSAAAMIISGDCSGTASAWPGVLFRGCRMRSNWSAPGAYNRNGFTTGGICWFNYCDAGGLDVVPPDICEVALTNEGSSRDKQYIIRCYSSINPGWIKNGSDGDAVIECYLDKVCAYDAIATYHPNGICLPGDQTASLVLRCKLDCSPQPDAISSNPVYAPQTSPIQMAADNGPYLGGGTNLDGSTGYRFIDNYLSGGAYTLHLGVDKANTLSDVHDVQVIGNQFSTIYFEEIGQSGVAYKVPTFGVQGNVWSGNTFFDDYGTGSWSHTTANASRQYPAGNGPRVGTTVPAPSGTAGNVTLTAAGGSYTLTGTAAALTTTGNQTLTAAAGSYTLTGASALFARGLISAAGTYTLTGTAATFLAGGNFTLFCNPGTYSLFGSAATFPGYDIAPPVQPSIEGSGYAGAWSGPKRRKRKRDEIEELIDAVISAPPPRAQPFTALQPPPPALVDLLPKMEAAGLTPPQRQIVKRAIVSDDEDDDDEAIELLLNLLS